MCIRDSLDLSLLFIKPGLLRVDLLLLGGQLGSQDLAYGVRLLSGGELRGHLLVGEFLDQPNSLEAEFLHNLNRTLFLAALLAGGAALLLALLLSHSLSGPLGNLALAVGVGRFGAVFRQIGLHSQQQRSV